MPLESVAQWADLGLAAAMWIHLAHKIKKHHEKIGLLEHWIGKLWEKVM